VHALDPQGLREVALQQPIPVASGENVNGCRGFRQLFETRAIALAQPDVGCNGISESKRIADYADTHGIRFQPHNASGPLLTAMSVAVDAAVPNFLIQEIFPYRPESWYGFLTDPLERRIVRGYLPIPTGPGLGVTLDEGYLARFAATRKAL
jgi:galactonate dehydratase